MFGPKWPKVVQCGPKQPISSKMVQDKLDDTKWSKNLVFQHNPQTSVGNFFFGTHRIEEYDNDK